ncbi:MAG: AAA family ATPase [Kofleriaceae bacterium]
MVVFPPFRLDVDEERLWKGSTELSLRRKPFAILRYLVAHPKRLVTHDELLEHVWAGAVVSESAVRSHLHELRQVLGEGVIETVIGRGYRFTAEIEDAALARGSVPIPVITNADVAIVGREGELETLRAALERAHAGQRQMVFVTGEPGIGKSTLVDAFLDRLHDRADIVAVRGGAIEQHGVPEAYLPVMEILAALRVSRHGDAALSAFVRYAPTFLAQVQHLIPDDKLDDVMGRARGGTESRMVRELNEAIEMLASTITLVLVFEDLQWSDIATLDLIGVLGQRRERARLLAITTSRRAEAQTVTHPLNRVMRGLVARSGALAIPLEQIGRDAIVALLAMRFPGSAFPAAFVDIVERITGGTPLFVVTLLDDLASRGMLVERDGTWSLVASLDDIAAHRPDSVKQLVDIQLDRLTIDEQRLLEAASVIGREFSTGLVAAALEQPVEQVDEVCDSLARRSLFLRRESTEEWPNGEMHTRYALSHALVHDVCAQRAAPSRRQRWHRIVAERLAMAYGDRSADIANVLSHHFDLGQQPGRAVEFYLRAAERCELRFASSDALAACRRARLLLGRMPEDRTRDQLELDILGHLAQAVVRVGNPDEEPLELFERMILLARRLADGPGLAKALVNLSYRYSTLARYRKATEVLDEFDALASTASLSPSILAFADAARAVAQIWLGQLASARAKLDALASPSLGADWGNPGILGPTDRVTLMTGYRALVQWIQGELDDALASAEMAVERAMASNDPYLIGGALCNVARLHLFRGRSFDEVREHADRVIARPTLAVWQSQAHLLLVWADAREGTLSSERLDEALGHYRARVAAFPLGTTFVAVTMVDTLRLAGRLDQALAFLDEKLSFIVTSEERVLESEFLGLRGDLIASADRGLAEEHYRRALALAISQGAHTFALRAATRLVQLTGDGREELGAALGRIVGGDDTMDVTTARSLLA